MERDYQRDWIHIWFLLKCLDRAQFLDPSPESLESFHSFRNIAWESPISRMDLPRLEHRFLYKISPASFCYAFEAFPESDAVPWTVLLVDS